MSENSKKISVKNKFKFSNTESRIGELIALRHTQLTTYCTKGLNFGFSDTQIKFPKNSRRARRARVSEIQKYFLGGFRFKSLQI